MRAEDAPILALAALLALGCGTALAYRPFDGTDAAVAGTGEVEVELGPVEYFAKEPSAVCSLLILGLTTASPQIGKRLSKAMSRMV